MVAVTQAHYADKRHAIAEICRTLGVSRATLDRYLSTPEAAQAAQAAFAAQGGAPMLGPPIPARLTRQGFFNTLQDKPNKPTLPTAGFDFHWFSE